MRKLKPSRDEYMIGTYRCPYCGNTYTGDVIMGHMDVCYEYHRKRIRDKRKEQHGRED